MGVRVSASRLAMIRKLQKEYHNTYMKEHFTGKQIEIIGHLVLEIIEECVSISVDESKGS